MKGRTPARLIYALMLIVSGLLATQGVSKAADSFVSGVEAYRAGNFVEAAAAFRTSVNERPSSGALLNLGLAEWHSTRPGPAIIAWEQSLWLNPFEARAGKNLRFARDSAQLESPDLRWYEVASTWLSPDTWAWLTGASLWLAVGVLVVPGVLRRRKRVWHQAVAALGLGVFLVCIPAHIGTTTRTQIGFVLEPETPLRLTPTSEAENITVLAAGEPVRSLESRGNFIFVRGSRATGWLRTSDVGFITR
ncbi:MAG TPA: hypothetical protein VEH04_17890 [Verrucomicrobiae bacterium]|nr:hypothetical protein [Verrucomicrobiae bacterium]